MRPLHKKSRGHNRHPHMDEASQLNHKQMEITGPTRHFSLSLETRDHLESLLVHVRVLSLAVTYALLALLSLHSGLASFSGHQTSPEQTPGLPCLELQWNSSQRMRTSVQQDGGGRKHHHQQRNPTLICSSLLPHLRPLGPLQQLKLRVPRNLQLPLHYARKLRRDPYHPYRKRLFNLHIDTGRRLQKHTNGAIMRPHIKVSPQPSACSLTNTQSPSSSAVIAP